MLSPQYVTETLILHLKDGVNLENMAPAGSPAEQAFVQSTKILKAQRGFVRQFWGHQVEDPTIFVGYIGYVTSKQTMHSSLIGDLHWESLEHITTFLTSEDYKPFMADADKVFDLEVAAPLKIYTHLDSDAAAALEAPVTEVAFFTLPDEGIEEAKKTIDSILAPSMDAVTTVGKSMGGATGWVFEVKLAGVAAPDGHSVALHGVYGYASVDDHLKWRATPEHAQVIKDMAPLGSLGMGNAIIPGGNTFVPDSSMFHVKFAPRFE